jgi:hypothetical protein
MTFEETLEFVNDSTPNHRGEIWKSHPVYDDMEGSNLGRIRRTYKGRTYIKIQRYNKSELKRKELVFTNSVNGKNICLYSSKFILECFSGIGNGEGYQCDHINSIPYDNRIDNLRWVECGKDNMNNDETKKKLSLSHKGTTRKKDIMSYDDFNDFKLKNEKWKHHPFYDNIEVSNMGRVIERIGDDFFEKVYSKRKGYLVVTIGKNENRKQIKVHRLVAQTWIPNPDNKEEVDHINNDKCDNRASNLRWANRSENMNNEITKTRHSKSVLQMDKNGNIIKIFNTVGDTVRDGFIRWHVRNACNTGKEYKGFIWKWKNPED